MPTSSDGKGDLRGKDMRGIRTTPRTAVTSSDTVSYPDELS